MLGLSYAEVVLQVCNQDLYRTYKYRVWGPNLSYLYNPKQKHLGVFVTAAGCHYIMPEIRIYSHLVLTLGKFLFYLLFQPLKSEQFVVSLFYVARVSIKVMQTRNNGVNRVMVEYFLKHKLLQNMSQVVCHTHSI